MPPPINPDLRPISEATYEMGPILLYSADASPYYVLALGASIDLGWVGNGSTPGVFTARGGFFKNFCLPAANFRWTHFLRAPRFQ